MKKSIPELVRLLNYYTEKYDEGHPEISDKEWDELYFELVTLEKEAGYALPDSPTQKITYSAVNQLNKVEHNHKMLSLNKSKDIEEINNFLGDKQYYIAMLKLDGLTCSLTYRGGRLVAAETRGNGFVGEDILHNAQVIPSIPKHINYQEELVVDGEIISTTINFEKFKDLYKNPRNFAAGSIRLLDSKVCAERGLRFVAWEVIKGLDHHISHKDPISGQRSEAKMYITDTPNLLLSDKLYDLNKLGFLTVLLVTGLKGPVEEQHIEMLKNDAKMLGYPIDGLVFKFNSLEYSKTLGETAHHFKNAMAYKFYDETYETELQDIEWSMGRTGVLTPVAIFDTIDMDGSEVSRASLHNLSIMEEILGQVPYRGQKLQVFKSNMIIPQIYSAERQVFTSNDALIVPSVCPICGQPLEIRNNDGVKTLYCSNPECNGKTLNKIEHFCGKKGLDIKGISEATIDKLMDWGWVQTAKDVFTLSLHRIEWINKDGFGEKSVDKILSAIEKAKENVTLVQFISALGIPLIGQSVAKLIVKEFSTWKVFMAAVTDNYDFSRIPTFGEAKSQAILYFDYTEANEIVKDYLVKLREVKEQKDNELLTAEENLFVKNKTFCITGKLHTFKNREELVGKIEAAGGRVVPSISSKVNYLINNDITSTSSKNKKAKELNIPIISEEDFLTRLQVDKFEK